MEYRWHSFWFVIFPRFFVIIEKGEFRYYLSPPLRWVTEAYADANVTIDHQLNLNDPEQWYNMHCNFELRDIKTLDTLTQEDVQGTNLPIQISGI